MKISKSAFFLFFILSCQFVFSQTIKTDSLVSIKVEKGNYFVSGIVGDENLKREIIEKIEIQLGNTVDYTGLKVVADALPFETDWRKEFETTLPKLKNWKSGVFIFSGKTNKTVEDFPNLPNEILSKEIFLISNESISLTKYRNKVVVLFSLATWCGPCVLQAEELKKFYSQNTAPNLEIIGLNVETSVEDKIDFRNFVNRRKFNYKMGFADKELIDFLIKISRLNGIPQALVIYDGKLYGIFAGGGERVFTQLKETVNKTLEISNLKIK